MYRGEKDGNKISNRIWTANNVSNKIKFRRKIIVLNLFVWNYLFWKLFCLLFYLKHLECLYLAFLYDQFLLGEKDVLIYHVHVKCRETKIRINQILTVSVDFEK